MSRPFPNTELEESLRARYSLIAGLDEAGRGALAGPVAVGAVILPLDDAEKMAKLETIKESKQLSAKKREELYTLIVQSCVAFGVGMASAERIDREGIVGGVRWAAKMAAQQLGISADFLLTDGNLHVPLNIPQTSINHGDKQSLSIAAASILAKVARDQYMIALDSLYPSYHFAQHKGYGTSQHLQALAEHGPLSLHRHTFAPLASTM